MKICCCWDDGVMTDLRVVDILRTYDAKATFNLNPGLMGENRVPNKWMDPAYRGWSHNGFCAGKLARRDIPEVYAGFQVASHCWLHENAGSSPDDEWIGHAIDARNYLEDVTGRSCPGFAWPCGISTPGTIAKLRDAGFAYGRTTAYTNDILDDNPEPLALKSNCHFLSPAFWTKFEAAKQTGAFYFWGHSYELYEYDALWAQFEGKIRTLSEDPDVEWVDVVDIVPLLRR